MVKIDRVNRMEIENAQEAFVTLLGQIKSDHKLKFLNWVCQEYNPVVTSEPGDGRGYELLEEPEAPELLDRIASDLRAAVPPTAIMPGEKQLFHPSSEMNGMSASNTLHVDSFLYPSEDDVDSLCEQLQVSRHYCLNCGAWKTAPLNFISHSISREQLKFIYKNLVPDLSGKEVVDVGSRLGPALYGGYVYSRASKITGIESNEEFCKLQQEIVARYHLSDRVQVVHSDVCLQAELLQSADLIILNNVFEFFCSLEEQASIWTFLYQSIRKRGCFIVSIPSIQEACKQLTFPTSLCLEEWVVEVSTGVDPQDEELGSIHLYCVL